MHSSNDKLTQLLDYAAQGWRIFPIKSNRKSPPLTAHAFKDASSDVKVIKAWHDQHPRANWAVATGSMSGVFVMDIDVKADKLGQEHWNLLKSLCADLYPTLTCKTPSGGKHYYYKYNPKLPVKSENGFMNGIDVKGDGGYIMIPPSSLDGVSYKWREDINEVANSPSSLHALISLGKKIAPPINLVDGGRNEGLFQYARSLNRYGVHMDTASKLVLAAANFCKPPYTEKDALVCLESGYSGKYGEHGTNLVSDEEILEIVEKLNESFAVVMFGSKCVILKESIDPIKRIKALGFWHISDFKNYYANKRVKIHKKLISYGELWFRHPERRQYDGIVFSPQKVYDNHYNLWIGYGCEPKKGNCELFIQHIREIICSNDVELFDYVIAWMADAVQNPAVRPGTALVLRGSQGTGKGLFAKHFGALFGQHYLHISNQKHLTGHFNAHLMSICLVFADEAVWGGNKSEEGVLKALVTEDTIPIEAKGKDVINVQNHTRLLIASNNQWAVPAGPSERRFVVMDVSAEKQRNHEYFKVLNAQMESGGREALLDYLLKYDLDGIELRKIPHTRALAEMKMHSMSAYEKFWYDKLVAGSINGPANGWPVTIFFEELYNAWCEHAQTSGVRYIGSQTSLGIEMKKLLPRYRVTKPKLRAGDFSKQAKCYELPSLEKCREHFDRHMDTEHEWDK